jgi:hypothetical protein
MPITATPLPSEGLRYLDVPEADDLAGVLPGLAAFRAADDAEKAAALDEATKDIDSAMPYQGRKLDTAQLLEFPRLIDEPLRATSNARSTTVDPTLVWDWDDDADAAVVPEDVRRATLYQADSILAGEREARIAAQHDGVVYELTGGLAESYKSTAGPGVPTGLCRRAWLLMRRYRLRSGRLA